MLTTSQIIKEFGLDAKKSLGQNFILDKNFTDKIAKSAGDLTTSEILEIGPGPGSLTRSILDMGAKKLIVIEKDQRCIQALNYLKEFYGERLEIINADALEIDEEKLFASVDKFKIIANLPYNVGTVLIIKWLKIAHKISSMTLMLQKEVVDRIVANVGDNHYGRLAVMVNHLCESKMLFTVNRNVFSPPPKVTSAIVQITPAVNSLHDVEFLRLEKLVAAAFNQRRKMIKSSLKNYPFKEGDIISNLQKLKIDENYRPENITVAQFCALANNS